MSQILGIDHSGKIIEAVTARLAEKGVLIDKVTPHGQSQRLSIRGMGNERKTTYDIAQLDTEPTPAELGALVLGVVNGVEARLRGNSLPEDEVEPEPVPEPTEPVPVPVDEDKLELIEIVKLVAQHGNVSKALRDRASAVLAKVGK